MSSSSGSVARSPLQIGQLYRLIQWVHKGDAAEIEKMLDHGVENLIDLTEPRDGIGALHVAASADDRDMLNLLLSAGANPDVQDKKGRTSVMMAAELGNDAAVELLARSHANFRLQDSKGKGVLFYCAGPTERHTRCLRVALTHQADVNNVSTEGDHIFQLMCENAQEFTCRCLSMLDAGADPDAANQNTGVTALMAAAKAGSARVVRAILKKGGRPDAVDKIRSTAVHYAAVGGCFEVIPLLSAYSADIGVVNVDECTPLHYAAAAGVAACCKFLVQRGCSPNLKNKEGLLPRQIAKDAGHKAAVKELKKKQNEKADGEESSDSHFISDLWVLTLHDWIHENEAELRQAFGGGESGTVTTEMVISVLQELKAPVELDQLQKIFSGLDEGKEGSVTIDEFISGVTYIKKPFLLSSYKPKEKKGKKGKRGAKGGGKKKKSARVSPMPICYLPPELMPRRPDGGPPLFMIEKCADGGDLPPERHPVTDDSAWYADEAEKAYISVNYCVARGDLKSVAHALSRGVPVDVKDPYYKTPLMAACLSHNLGMAQYLLSQGADVNAVDGLFWTPLHHAAYAGHLELIKLLVEAGANVDARALNGGTPLMRAIQTSQQSCVDFLIKAGADVKAETKAGKKCLDIAKDFEDSGIIDLLKNIMESLTEPEEDTKGKGGKSQQAQKDNKPAKAKI
ncbi:ankyrin repeat and EF-hand domain-containing protein 1-like [Brachionichthys hirsutus]|uniref:ankyrin repeat and EF-hand domain-containing protein 1-like n=1 Tax=Brachionichthys hirsutus TaxID=412623 RepID=UPI003604A5DB